MEETEGMATHDNAISDSDQDNKRKYGGNTEEAGVYDSGNERVGI